MFSPTLKSKYHTGNIKYSKMLLKQHLRDSQAKSDLAKVNCYCNLRKHAKKTFSRCIYLNELEVKRASQNPGASYKNTNDQIIFRAPEILFACKVRIILLRYCDTFKVSLTPDRHCVFTKDCVYCALKCFVFHIVSFINLATVLRIYYATFS